MKKCMTGCLYLVFCVVFCCAFSGIAFGAPKCPKGYQLESAGILQPDIIKRIKGSALRGGKVCVAIRRPQLHKKKFSCPKPMQVEKSSIIVKPHRKRLLAKKINKGAICVIFAPPGGAPPPKKAVKKAPPQKKVPLQTPEELAKARKQHMKFLKKKFKKAFKKHDILVVDWPKVGVVVLVGGKFNDITDDYLYDKDLRIFRASDNAVLYALMEHNEPADMISLEYHKLKKSYVRKDNTFVVGVQVKLGDHDRGCEWKTKLELCASPAGDELGICGKEGIPLDYLEDPRDIGEEDEDVLNMPKKCLEAESFNMP